jgi:hypothetical protein
MVEKQVSWAATVVIGRESAKKKEADKVFGRHRTSLLAHHN